MGLDVTKWEKLRPIIRVLLLFSMIFLILSGFIIAADFILAEDICFRKFKITDSISADHELGGLNKNVLNIVILPVGAIALSLAFIGCILHVAIGKWMTTVARLKMQRSRQRNMRGWQIPMMKREPLQRIMGGLPK